MVREGSIRFSQVFQFDMENGYGVEEEGIGWGMEMGNSQLNFDRN